MSPVRAKPFFSIDCLRYVHRNTGSESVIDSKSAAGTVVGGGFTSMFS